MNTEEDMVAWQDVLDLIQQGRTDVECPFCHRSQIEVTTKGLVARILCPKCRKFVDGPMPNE